MWHHPAILPDSIPFDSRISLLRIHPKKNVQNSKNDIRYTRLFIAAALVVVEDQKSPMAMIRGWVNKPVPYYSTTHGGVLQLGKEEYFYIVWNDHYV